jgi:type IV secretory pathway TrbD component
MTQHAIDPLSCHAASTHTGFHERDPEFQALRTAHHELLRDFLCVMDEAGRPGVRRKLGSTILRLTGQPTEHYWATVLADESGHHREVLIFDDCTHGWSDEISYSDRPRNCQDEMPVDLLRTALDQILADNDLRWPDHPRTRVVPAAEPEDRESRVEYRRHRQLEYALMMGFRLLCLAAAVTVAALDVPYAPLWIALLGIGMVFLPMCAVLEANDHHPRRRRVPRRRLHAH